MGTLFWIIIATFVISAISLVGVVTFIFNEKVLRMVTIPLVAFSAGAMIGGAFLHLLPEALGEGETVNIFLIAIFGFTAFFFLEQFIHWHHCHQVPSEHKHPVTYLILFSDSVHNFIDGIAIGAAFIANIGLGIAASLAVAAHEIPQEFGDFGILIHGGWDKKKALMFNFFSGLTAVAGGVLVWAIAADIKIGYILPFAAGNFIYIAASDLIPEIKHSDILRQNLIHLFSFLLGIGFMWGLLYFKLG